MERRVAAGGHPVREEKVRSRYERLWGLVRQAIEVSDTANVYDSSRHGRPLLLAQFAHGVQVGTAHWPAWTPPALTTPGP